MSRRFATLPVLCLRVASTLCKVVARLDIYGLMGFMARSRL